MSVGFTVFGLLTLLFMTVYSFKTAMDTLVKLDFPGHDGETFPSLYIKLIRKDFEGINVCGFARGFYYFGQVIFFVFGGVFLIPFILVFSFIKEVTKKKPN